MKKLSPIGMKDWEIASEAEKGMKTIYQIGEELNLKKEELFAYGHYIGKLDYSGIASRLNSVKNGKYIDITAITPTPLGEGKSTTTLGLIQGLGRRGKRVMGAIRQPSGGPTFNIKGSAAGGGLSQCIPLTEFSLGLTGDIDAITNAHNLCMVALTSRMQHEFNYGDEILAAKKLKRLNINPRNVKFKWAIDFCAQSLRDVIVGIGGKMDGFMMESGFQISVSSELMAILAVAGSLEDLRKRISRIVVAYDKSGHPVTTADLEVDGAMTAIMTKAMNPNLMQTIEGQPVLVHAGPFANISIGQSSIIADKLGLKLVDYHITESGFGADIGFEKFWNIKCRMSGLKPDCAVIVATIRALKMHGGGPRVVPGKPLDHVYTEKNIPLLEEGLENLMANIEIVKLSGISPVVCLNHFYTDSDEEVKLVLEACRRTGTRAAVSKHWEKGGEGALELADAVLDACEDSHNFHYLYKEKDSLSKRIELIAKQVYGAKGVSYSDSAMEKIQHVESCSSFNKYGTCMVKTHLSLSHKPHLKGRPEDWVLPIEDLLLYKGAELIVPVAGDIKLMPGTASDPSFRKIDVNVETGKVTGLF